MTPTLRKITYAVSFETGGILLGGLVLHLVSQAPISRSLALSSISAAIALLWSYLFNTMFEAWEARQPARGRSFLRRTSHALLFEAGLTLILVPVTAWWLDATLLAAFLYESSLIGFFLVYAWAFTWGFDRIFGLPESAK
jgi:uncharacterized membrane protein